jgi:predicted nucleic acid-binding protein
MKSYKYNAFILIAVALLMVGCANTAQMIDNSYKTLSVSKVTYDSTMTSLADLKKANAIEDSAVEKAIMWGTLYMLSHNTAVASLLAYEVNQTDENKEELLARMQETATKLSDLLLFIRLEVLEK